MSEERLAETLERLIGLIDPVLAREGLERVDLELKRGPKRYLLKLTIDKQGTAPYRGVAPTKHDTPPESSDSVGIDDCMRISKTLGPILDVEDVLPTAYNLEISSPGVNRPLMRPDHYRRALGLDVRVKTRIPVTPAEGGQPESFFVAPLIEAGDETFVLDVRGRRTEIPYRLVSQANIEYRF